MPQYTNFRLEKNYRNAEIFATEIVSKQEPLSNGEDVENTFEHAANFTNRINRPCRK